jgi:hypothetical protein
MTVLDSPVEQVTTSFFVTVLVMQATLGQVLANVREQEPCQRRGMKLAGARKPLRRGDLREGLTFARQAASFGCARGGPEDFTLLGG